LIHNEKDIVGSKMGRRQSADTLLYRLFVEQAIASCQELIKQAGGHAPLIAKIEKAEAIDHLDDISRLRTE